MAKQVIDWITIKQFYFSNPETTVRDVADRFDANFYSVRNRARDEKWHKEREKQFARVEARVLEEQGEDITTIRVRQSKILKSMLAKVLSRLQNVDFSGLKEVELVKVTLDILKSERELYPKQLEMVGKLPAALSIEEVPQEIVDAFIEVFEKKIRGDSVPRVQGIA